MLIVFPPSGTADTGWFYTPQVGTARALCAGKVAYGPPSRITEYELDLIDKIETLGAKPPSAARDTMSIEQIPDAQLEQRKREAGAVLILHDVFGGVFRATEILSTTNGRSPSSSPAPKDHLMQARTTVSLQRRPETTESSQRLSIRRVEQQAGEHAENPSHVNVAPGILASVWGTDRLRRWSAPPDYGEETEDDVEKEEQDEQAPAFTSPPRLRFKEAFVSPPRERYREYGHIA